MAPTFVQWKMRPQNSRMSGQNHDIEKNVDSTSRNQVIGKSIDNKIGNAVDNAVMAVGNRTQDAFLRAMDKLVIPRIELAVRSITGSSGHGTYSVVQNPDRREFTRNRKHSAHAACSRLDLNIDQERIDKTRDIENFEDDDFPALRPYLDRRAHAHHTLLLNCFLSICIQMKPT